MNLSELNAIKKSSGHTLQLAEVIDSERAYILERRAHNEVERESLDTDPSDLWGCCISGGGIRSATLGLGMIQALIREDVFREFDYLSTVSGGGYIGSCLTSLMNNDSDIFVNPEKVEIEPGRSTEPSEASLAAFRKHVPGIRPTTSPFNNLLAFEYESQGKDKQVDLDYKAPKRARLDVRHQLHHLRLHGTYLTLNQNFVSRDIQRLIGTVLSGILHNFTLFFLAMLTVVSAHYGLFYYLSNGAFFEEVSYDEIESGYTGIAFALEALKNWLTIGIPKQWNLIYTGFITHLDLGLTTFGVGIGIGLYLLLRVRIIVNRIRNDQMSTEFRRDTESGYNLEDHHENRFVKRSLTFGIAGGPILAFGLAILLGLRHESGDAYWILFSLPLCYALGIFLAVSSAVPFMLSRPAAWSESQQQELAWRERLVRSLFGGLQGSALSSVLISAITPIGLVTLFSFNVTFSFISSLVSIAVAYLAYRQNFADDSFLSRFFHKLQMPVLNLSMLLFVSLAFASIATALMYTKVWHITYAGMVINVPLLLMLGAAVLFVGLGLLVNSNKISLHYFYRDRLAETYLKTDGKVDRGDNSQQGNPLVNLRNNENLLLKDLGWEEDKTYHRKQAQNGPDPVDQLAPGYRYSDDRTRRWKINARAPYHLIVAALNLQDSDELVRKDLKSEHFVFSRNYIGSASTGYVKTEHYRKGKTKLARAMAISAAAVSSGMGFSTFFAQSFLTTLFNLRLGYWIENPWYYRAVDERKDVIWPLHWLRRMRLGTFGGWRINQKRWTYMKEAAKRFKHYGNWFIRPICRPLIPPDRKYTFWPYYLFKELMAWTTARTRMVNVSDGGHTGDNLGLVPLLRRRCKVIVACDFEEDRKFAFRSFNHAMRMAYIEENVTIDINLEEVMPLQGDTERISKSKANFTTGIITYIDGSKGTLIYIKSSLSGFLPSRVYNYQQANGDFPHQSTADQYFDDAQFEAYRALGEHMGCNVVPVIQNAIAGNPPSINKDFRV